ncbi:hypothetical protein D3C71_1748380 [compost metagenome]
MRHGIQLDAEETRVVFDVFDGDPASPQRVRSLQRVARIVHLGDQPADPLVQLQLQQTAILGGADVFALDQLQVMGNA